MIAWVVLIYGILIAAGGVMGYVKAHSAPSLIAGSISGIALLGAAWAMMKDSYSAGWWISLIVAVLLLGRFVNAARSGFKMMPGGMVIILSIIVIAALLANRTR
ncbi:MAG: TMEM14 family protein [Chloracidobacterium sp.]|nr:TMEM14 family protein [Chloracidobacterium sp.]